MVMQRWMLVLQMPSTLLLGYGWRIKRIEEEMHFFFRKQTRAGSWKDDPTATERTDAAQSQAWASFDGAGPKNEEMLKI